MNSIKITFFKELRSIFRDKKTISMLLLFPFIIPVVIFLYAGIYDEQSQDKLYEIGVDYVLNSNEISMLDEANLKYIMYSDKKAMEKAYQHGDIYGYIDYSKEENKYYYYVNEESEDGMYVNSYIKSYLESYNRYLGDLSLIGEDIDVDQVYHNFSYELVHLDGDNFFLTLMFSLAFTYIVMAIVTATTNMATSATAVEKENGTLETILTFPIKTKDLILGKYLATVSLGIFSSVMGLVLALISLVFSMRCYDFFKDISLNVNVINVSLAIFIVILASFFIAGVAIALTSFAKSYKEAQSISSFLNMLTIVPMFISMFHISLSKWYYLIPIFNHTQVLMDLFSGVYDFTEIGMVIFSSLFYVILVINYIIKRYHTEKVLF